MYCVYSCDEQKSNSVFKQGIHDVAEKSRTEPNNGRREI